MVQDMSYEGAEGPVLALWSCCHTVELGLHILLVLVTTTAHASELMVVGNQWYWVYTTTDTSLFLYAVREHELVVGDLRLLHTTQCAVVDGEPYYQHASMLCRYVPGVTASCVLLGTTMVSS